MKTIDEIQRELRDLIRELDQIKEERSANSLEIDWEHLSVDSAANPICPHPLEAFDEYSQKCYLSLLLNTARLDAEKLPESLYLIHRIAFGMKYLNSHENLQEEFVSAQTLSYIQLDEIVQLFKNTDEKLMLVLECMLLAGIFGNGKKAAVEYTVKLSELLGLTKENLVFLSNLAAVVLTQNLDNYKCDRRNEWEMFYAYIKNMVSMYSSPIHKLLFGCYYISDGFRHIMGLPLNSRYARPNDEDLDDYYYSEGE